MANNRKQRVKSFIDSEQVDLHKFSEFISEDIDDTELLTQILKNAQDEKLSLGDRLADAVANFGGSWQFIITFFILLLSWIGINLYLLKNKAFDPYPFILLNLILSCLAAIQAPIIMMSQNRKEEKDRQRAQNDYLINLKAEMEIKNIQANMKKLFEIQKQQMFMMEEILRKAEK
ncbi:MAG: DUF1003 domain-containing protein [Chitinophagales bacterium]|nr:DUF1003 domain-containing protein [Chitinophagales bacterium]